MLPWESGGLQTVCVRVGGGEERGWGGAGISKAGKPAVASRDLEVWPVDRVWEFGVEEI